MESENIVSAVDRQNDKPLVFVLAMLCVVIVGLIFGVIFVIFHDDNTDKVVGDVGQSEVDIAIADGYYPSSEESDEAFEYNYGYLTGMIATGQTDEGQPLDENEKIFLQMNLVELMLQYDQASDALEYLNGLNIESYSDEEKMRAYTLFSWAYELLGDEERALLYSDMAVAIGDDSGGANE